MVGVWGKGLVAAAAVVVVVRVETTMDKSDIPGEKYSSNLSFLSFSLVFFWGRFWGWLGNGGDILLIFSVLCVCGMGGKRCCDF